MSTNTWHNSITGSGLTFGYLLLSSPSMARKPRIQYPGAVYHVILRGNAGEPIFFSDRDRYRLYLILQYAVEKFGCRIHGFCLMANHLHLVIQIGNISLSRIMQNISLRYTQWINLTWTRTGHVFQGRYKALLLDADAYLLELVRYVHLNPVRAGMVAAPEDYPWSGHRGYLGIEFLPWLTTQWVLSMFAPGSGQAQSAYRVFVADGISEATRRNEFHRGTHEERILGDNRFAEETLSRVNQARRRAFSLTDVIAAVCRRYAISESQFKAQGKTRPYTEARAIAAFFVRESDHLSLTDLAGLLGRDVSALGKAAERIARDVVEGSAVRSMVEALRFDLAKISETLT